MAWNHSDDSGILSAAVKAEDDGPLIFGADQPASVDLHLPVDRDRLEVLVTALGGTPQQIRIRLSKAQTEKLLRLGYHLFGYDEFPPQS